MADPPQEGFLPPEPAGPEPELGKPPQRPETQPPAYGAPGHWGHGQPPPPPPPQQPQWGPGWQGPQGWQTPQGWWQPQPWSYPQEPDNGPAVTGFVLAMVSAGLWLMSVGLSSLLSLGLAIGGLITSRNGKRKVAAGETGKHRGLAQAGFISSIVMIGLSTLSTLGWGAFFILLAVDEDFRDDLDDSDDGDSFDGDSIRAVLAVLRAGAKLLT